MHKNSIIIQFQNCVYYHHAQVQPVFCFSLFRFVHARCNPFLVVVLIFRFDAYVAQRTRPHPSLEIKWKY